MQQPIPAPPVLIGRDRELTILRQQFDAARAGNGRVVLIGGEAGIGKTALAEVLCREATERGALVLVGRCYDLTETPPYGPWVALFGRYRPEVGLPPLPDAFATTGTVGDVTSRAQLFQDVLDFFVALSAARTIVVLLEDIHWADPASLDLLRFLARFLADLPILLIATYRSDELTRRHPLYALLPLLEHEASATRLDLRRLSSDAVRALVTARYHLPDAEEARLVTYLHERTEGNALFLHQILRALVEDSILQLRDGYWTLDDLKRLGVPIPLRQIIDARLLRLGESAANSLAVAG
jgi:predicted ATPase